MGDFMHMSHGSGLVHGENDTRSLPRSPFPLHFGGVELALQRSIMVDINLSSLRREAIHGFSPRGVNPNSQCETTEPFNKMCSN